MTRDEKLQIKHREKPKNISRLGLERRKNLEKPLEESIIASKWSSILIKEEHIAASKIQKLGFIFKYVCVLHLFLCV